MVGEQWQGSRPMHHWPSSSGNQGLYVGDQQRRCRQHATTATVCLLHLAYDEQHGVQSFILNFVKHSFWREVHSREDNDNHILIVLEVASTVEHFPKKFVMILPALVLIVIGIAIGGGAGGGSSGYKFGNPAVGDRNVICPMVTILVACLL
ncbi:hypothetical protein Nepgr_033136 [Nepenthes gracilis]|uniref:Uncharacterized protein n=1 Tax=Nepenthes gracilis TaxID=150966 RepID=A0AAD3TJY8_NEPGR|nr:hypothetical protein Nepgr_033136 [Nepenthes gracilis]